MQQSIDNLHPEQVAKLLEALARVLEANKSVGTFMKLESNIREKINDLITSIKK